MRRRASGATRGEQDSHSSVAKADGAVATVTSATDTTTAPSSAQFVAADTHSHSLDHPCVALPLAILFFVVFQLTVSYLFTHTLSFGLYEPVVNLLRKHSVIERHEWPHFSLQELRRFDGHDPSLPLYLAILGHVFDVSSGRHHYGPTGGYHIFAGRDGSRAFITGCFNERGAISDVRGLNEMQLKQLTEWRDFYHSHKTYRFVGYVLEEGTEEERMKRPLPDDTQCRQAKPEVT